MARLQSKRFDEPDELVTLPLVSVQVVLLGEAHVARLVHQPGWSWAEHVKPVAGTPSCQHHHQGVVLEGEVEVETDTGARRILRAGEAFEIPPGHDARVIGDRPFVTIEFGGVHGWAKPAEAGERFVATLLVTDIVDSTKVAVRLGDAAWKELLARHNEGVRIQLDRFRGVEVHTTGDGFLAFFDGAARAVRCAAAIRDGAPRDGLQIRAGVHSGEVERDAGDLRGVAVHAVARIAALASPHEVLVSAPTASLLEGASIRLEDAGEHELKGLAGARRVYRLVGLATE
ncbi:MAG TPA: adenylate/guanylate cyclase domain-containing protein [Propionibacteriaceae bacterium]|nr:adenylate/guanylate cyclase domain-containing protein [Propionibacteriaceae bacterium]